MSWSLAFGALGLLESMTSKNKASSQFDQAYGFNRMAFDKTFEEDEKMRELKEESERLKKKNMIELKKEKEAIEKAI